MTRLIILRLLTPLMGRKPWLFYPIASVCATVAWHLLPRRRRNLVRNMMPLCDGDRARARREGKRAYQNVGRYWVDLSTLPYRDLSTFERDHVHGHGLERLQVLECPGPVVVVSAHTGNAELVIQALTYRGRPFAAIVETLEPRAFAEYLLRLRSVSGGEFHEATFAGLRACLARLRDGGLVGVMADRDLQGSGVPVTLCGRQVYVPSGPWELARRTGAVVLPVLTARRGRDDFDVYVEEPFHVEDTEDPEVGVRKAAEQWALVLEQHLRRDPGQWAVLEDFWRVHGVG